jgi:hypothetical protein
MNLNKALKLAKDLDKKLVKKADVDDLIREYLKLKNAAQPGFALEGAVRVVVGDRDFGLYEYEFDEQEWFPVRVQGTINITGEQLVNEASEFRAQIEAEERKFEEQETKEMEERHERERAERPGRLR